MAILRSELLGEETMGTKPKRQTQVRTELEALIEEQGRGTSIQAEVEEQLSFVLLSPKLATSENKQEEEAGIERSALVNKIHQIRLQICETNDKYRSLLQRLEL